MTEDEMTAAALLYVEEGLLRMFNREDGRATVASFVAGELVIVVSRAEAIALEPVPSALASGRTPPGR